MNRVVKLIQRRDPHQLSLLPLHLTRGTQEQLVELKERIGAVMARLERYRVTGTFGANRMPQGDLLMAFGPLRSRWVAWPLSAFVNRIATLREIFAHPQIDPEIPLSEQPTYRPPSRMIIAIDLVNCLAIVHFWYLDAQVRSSITCEGTSASICDQPPITTACLTLCTAGVLNAIYLDLKTLRVIGQLGRYLQTGQEIARAIDLAIKERLTPRSPRSAHTGGFVAGRRRFLPRSSSA